METRHTFRLLLECKNKVSWHLKNLSIKEHHYHSFVVYGQRINARLFVSVKSSKYIIRSYNSYYNANSVPTFTAYSISKVLLFATDCSRISSVAVLWCHFRIHSICVPVIAASIETQDPPGELGWACSELFCPENPHLKNTNLHLHLSIVTRIHGRFPKAWILLRWVLITTLTTECCQKCFNIEMSLLELVYYSDVIQQNKLVNNTITEI